MLKCLACPINGSSFIITMHALVNSKNNNNILNPATLKMRLTSSLTLSFLHTYCWSLTRLGWKQNQLQLRMGRMWRGHEDRFLLQHYKGRIYLHLYVNHFSVGLFVAESLPRKIKTFSRWHTQRHGNSTLGMTTDIWLLLKFNTHTWRKSIFHDTLY